MHAPDRVYFLENGMKEKCSIWTKTSKFYHIRPAICHRFWCHAVKNGQLIIYEIKWHPKNNLWWCTTVAIEGKRKWRIGQTIYLLYRVQAKLHVCLESAGEEKNTTCFRLHQPHFVFKSHVFRGKMIKIFEAMKT